MPQTARRPTASSTTARSARRSAASRGLSTELEDVTEVEYRQLRLENVVLIGVYSQGSQEDAENSMRELAALAETAGAVVLDGLLQRRPHPDPSTYLGRGKAQELRRRRRRARRRHRRSPTPSSPRASGARWRTW